MILSLLLQILYIILWVYQGIIFISIILSWIPSLYEYKIFQMINTASNWYMKPFRGILVLGMLDFTPIIGILIYQFILNTIVQIA